MRLARRGGRAGSRRRLGVLVGLLLLGFVACGSDPTPADEPTETRRVLRTLPGLEASAARAINQRELSPAPEGGRYRFLVGGHLYGDPRRPPEVCARTLTAALPRLARRDERFFLALGDCVFHHASLPRFAEAMKAFSVPVFVAPGNHDLGDRDAYVARFGPTFGHFLHGEDVFVLFDSEIVPWDLDAAQRDLLDRVVARLESGPPVRHVFFAAHKLIFAVQERYGPLLLHTNAADGLKGRTRFEAEIAPLLARIAKRHRVVWFGGDIGARPRSRGLYCQKDAATGVTYVAVGLGDVPEDALISVDVAPEGIGFDLVPLGERPPRALERHDLESWIEAFYPDGKGR